MYGREKIAVVIPTNAVSATRNTLKASTKNCPRSASCGPSKITVTASAAAAANVQAVTAMFTSGATGRCPTSASAIAPASGRTSRRTISITVFLPVEMLEVEVVELLADLEEEDTEDQDANQHIERNAELDDHRHAI